MDERSAAASPSCGGLRRRAIIAGIPAAAASAAVLGSSGCTSPATPTSGGRILRFFTSHEAAVVEDATARIAPGPGDDPAETGHPGAREAGVTDYIDIMLGSLGSLGSSGSSGSPGSTGSPGSLAGTSGGQGGGAPAPMIFAGGPWSNRHTSGPDLMASFIPLDPVALIAWRRRLAGWQQQYREGIATLDELAGGDFTKATPADQDKILVRQAVSTFTALLFEHTIEGLYAVPEYGGNRGLVGWKDIAFPGDIQPRGYTADEVSRSDGPDPLDNTGVVADVLKFLGAL